MRSLSDAPHLRVLGPVRAQQYGYIDEYFGHTLSEHAHEDLTLTQHQRSCRDDRQEDSETKQRSNCSKSTKTERMLRDLPEELYQPPWQPPKVARKWRGEKTCVAAGPRLFQQHVRCDFVPARQRSRGDERIVEGVEHECRNADMAQPPSR